MFHLSPILIYVNPHIEDVVGSWVHTLPDNLQIPACDGHLADQGDSQRVLELDVCRVHLETERTTHNPITSTESAVYTSVISLQISMAYRLPV